MDTTRAPVGCTVPVTKVINPRSGPRSEMSELGVQRKTMTAQVADAIRQRILSGELKGGDRLRQEHIAVELGVSRIPVREALHQLHSEGFVTLISQKGAVVAEMPTEAVLEMFELRARVETWLLALAIPRMTERDLERAQEAAELFDMEGQHSAYSHGLNWRFHEALYRPSGRLLTIEMMAKNHQQIERYTRMMVTLAGNQEKSAREHTILLEVCRAKDTLRATNLLDQHIMDGGKFLISKLAALQEPRTSTRD